MGIVAALSTLAARKQSAILLAIIFHLRIIPALKRVKYRPAPAAKLPTRNLAIYGVGGITAPSIGIKLIDLVVTALHLAWLSLSERPDDQILPSRRHRIVFAGCGLRPKCRACNHRRCPCCRNCERTHVVH